MRLKWWLVCLALVLTAPVSWQEAQAKSITRQPDVAPYPTQEEARYRIYWNGIRIGKIWASWKQENGQYEMHASLKTSGIAKLFSKQERNAVISGIVTETAFIPQRFNASVIRRKKQRHVSILYDMKGNVTSSTVDPPDNPKIRPPVSQKGKDSGYDPLSATQALLDFALQYRQHKSQNNLAFDVFDSRRLTGADIQASSNETCSGDCVVLSGTRRLLEGFTEKERKKHKPDEPPVFLEVKPEHSRFPERIYGRSPLGTVIAIRQDD